MPAIEERIAQRARIVFLGPTQFAHNVCRRHHLTVVLARRPKAGNRCETYNFDEWLESVAADRGIGVIRRNIHPGVRFIALREHRRAPSFWRFYRRDLSPPQARRLQERFSDGQKALRIRREHHVSGVQDLEPRAANGLVCRPTGAR